MINKTENKNEFSNVLACVVREKSKQVDAIRRVALDILKGNR